MRNFQIPVAVCNKFDAGVTSSQWHPHKEHVFAVGSYDETVSLWDVRNLKTELLRSNTGCYCIHAVLTIHINKLTIEYYSARFNTLNLIRKATK